jgi:hypothetical protein
MDSNKGDFLVVVAINHAFCHSNNELRNNTEGPGANQGDTTDLEELKDFVMAELLWDPTLDPDALIAEFIVGYYGEACTVTMCLFLMLKFHRDRAQISGCEACGVLVCVCVCVFVFV